MKNHMKVNPIKWIELAASQISSTLHNLKALHDSGDVGAAVKDQVDLLEDFVKVAGLPSESFNTHRTVARLSFPGKAKSSVFTNLMVRCLEHEFDVSVAVEHTGYLLIDIEEAFNRMDISEDEYLRLREQLQLTRKAALTECIDGVRNRHDKE